MTHDLIFLSLEPWDDIWRRNQFVCAALARRHPALKILFVNPARDLSNALRRRNFQDASPEPLTPLPDFPNITLTRPTKLLPNTLSIGRRFNEFLLRRHVRRAAARLGLKNPLLWINPHSAVHMAGRMHESAVLYDITDDWTSFTQTPSHIALIKRQDAELCAKADAVIVCSERLRQMKASHPGIAPKLHLIPNGVDAAHYAPIGTGTLTPPAAANSWPKPVFGYTGTIHGDRVDLPLVEQLADSLTAGSIVLVGPAHLAPEHAAKLTRTGKIFLTGPVPYQQIPAYMDSFDVCITPHRMTPFTESLNPIKLWEYLAAGKPIVSTDVAGFRDYPQHVRIARNAEEFMKALSQALLDNPKNIAARRTEAQRHSWESRIDRIEEILNRAHFAREAASVSVLKVGTVQ